MKIKNLLKFDLKKEEIIKETTKIIKESRDFYNSIEKSEKVDFQIIKKISIKEAELQTRIENIKFYSFVSEDKDLREESTNSSKLFEEYKIEISMKKEIYQVLKKVKENEKGLTKLELRVLNKMIRFIFFYFKKTGNMKKTD
jgi:Zn-dependent oligopeptidase